MQMPTVASKKVSVRTSTWICQQMLQLAILAALACFSISTPFAQSEEQDRSGHEGYYYPTPQSEDRYRPRVQNAGQPDRRTRVGFTTGLTAQMLNSPSPPRFAIFAKGSEAEKLIIVALSDDSYNTLYRLRALLAMLTAYARSSPAFQGHPHPENLTFLDLIFLIGFEQVVVSDGRDIAHRIYLDPTAP